MSSVESQTEKKGAFSLDRGSGSVSRRSGSVASVFRLRIDASEEKGGKIMKKKVVATTLAFGMTLALAACAEPANSGTDVPNPDAPQEAEAQQSAEAEQPAAETATEAPAENAETPAEGEDASADVMSYADYLAADVDTQVVVETYVQAKQGWWEKDGVGGVATFYTQDENGGYFLYDMPCSEEDYNKLTEGTKIKVTGYKSEWSGEIEIVDATFEIEDGNYIAEPVDVTEIYGTDAIADYMNQRISIKGAVVADKGDGAAFLYKWDGSGTQGDDIYFDIELNGATYTVTVESYLCGKDTDVYQAVEGMHVGDTVDLEGFLYWYEGAQPHITGIGVKHN